MLDCITLPSFSNQDFAVPGVFTRQNFLLSGGVRELKQTYEALEVGTTILSLLPHLDVPESRLDEACAGVIDGFWTENTRKLAADLQVETGYLEGISYYREVGTGWRCPVCSQSKSSIVRRATQRHRKPHNIFHAHHDHFEDIGCNPRFPRTIVCQYCNSFDEILKRRINEPGRAAWNQCEEDARWETSTGDNFVFREFSFSPFELRYIMGGYENLDMKALPQDVVARAKTVYDDCFSLGLDCLIKLDCETPKPETDYRNYGVFYLSTKIPISSRHLSHLSHAMPSASGWKHYEKTFNTTDNRTAWALPRDSRGRLRAKAEPGFISFVTAAVNHRIELINRTGPDAGNDVEDRLNFHKLEIGFTGDPDQPDVIIRLGEIEVLADDIEANTHEIERAVLTPWMRFRLKARLATSPKATIWLDELRNKPIFEKPNE